MIRGSVRALPQRPWQKNNLWILSIYFIIVAVRKDRHIDYVKEGIDCRNMMCVCQADQTKTNEFVD